MVCQLKLTKPFLNYVFYMAQPRTRYSIEKHRLNNHVFFIKRKSLAYGNATHLIPILLKKMGV